MLTCTLRAQHMHVGYASIFCWEHIFCLIRSSNDRKMYLPPPYAPPCIFSFFQYILVQRPLCTPPALEIQRKGKTRPLSPQLSCSLHVCTIALLPSAHASPCNAGPHRPRTALGTSFRPSPAQHAATRAAQPMHATMPSMHHAIHAPCNPCMTFNQIQHISTAHIAILWSNHGRFRHGYQFGAEFPNVSDWPRDSSPPLAA